MTPVRDPATSNPIHCDSHGERESAFVCRHLLEGIELGFHAADDAESLLWPDAWCDRCEAMVSAAGEWNDAAMAFADIQLVCSGCYEQIRERNWRQDDDAFACLVQSAVDFLNRQQADMRERYPIDECDRYDWDQARAQLVFSHQGKARVVADIVFTGSFSTATNTWMWSWANASLEQGVKAGMLRVRELGAEQGFLRLTSAHWSADEIDGWEMTAIAAQLLHAEGAYRTPEEHGFTYMIFTGLTEVH